MAPRPMGRLQSPPMASPRSTLAVCFASIFVVGILSGALGPFLPQLSGRIGVPVEALGAMFTALFLGALIMQLAGGWLNEVVGLRAMLVAGVALLTLGILGITVSPDLAVLLVCAFLAGAGQGTLDVSTNVLVAAVFEEKAVVSAVNLLHFAFGAGAVLSPFLTTQAVARWGSPMPVLWLGAALGAATALAAGRWAMDAKPGRPGEVRPEEANAVYARPALWLLSLLLFLYVGVEMGVGGWTTIYAERTTSLAPGSIALLLSAYWLALTAGRLIGAVLGTRVSSRALATVAVLGACLGSSLVVLGSGSAGWTAAGTAILGLSFGPIFPTVVVMATELFRAAPSRAVSVIIAVSSLGGMALPPLQGLLLTRVTPLSSVALVAAACFGMLVLLLAARERRG
jgi:MFS transporter, FHS family, L-fucose permease